MLIFIVYHFLSLIINNQKWVVCLSLDRQVVQISIWWLLVDDQGFIDRNKNRKWSNCLKKFSGDVEVQDLKFSINKLSCDKHFHECVLTLYVIIGDSGYKMKSIEKLISIEKSLVYCSFFILFFHSRIINIFYVYFIGYWNQTFSALWSK